MLRFPSIPLAFAALCLVAAPGSAQISFSSAIDMALRSDPKIRAAEANVEKARAVLAGTHDAFIPSASASGGYGTSTGVPLGVPVVFSLASQSLLFNFAQKDNVRAASSGVQAATLALQESHDQVAEDVAVTYLNLSNAQERQAAMSQEYGYATRLENIVQDRLDAGRDSRIELLRARRTVAQIHLQQLQIENEVAMLASHLARLIGLPGNKLTTVAATIPALPPINSLNGEGSDSFGIQSAVASAESKHEIAFGEARYRFRPQISFGANYSRISTSHTNYIDYYPGFKQKSESAASIGIQITVPLYDRGHQDRAHEAAAEADRAYFDAEDQRNQFLDGRFRLQHSASELAARSELAEIDRDLAQEQLETVLVQLAAESASAGGQLMTPKDEQNARLQERARTIDLLNAQFQLNQAQVNLLRQTGQLDAWLKSIAVQSTPPTATPSIKP
jgi:outer membrane protein TolC